jgi:HEAT repeat protein
MNSDQPDIEQLVKDGNLDGLITALDQSHDPENRVQAATALGQMGGTSATRALVGALRASDISVRVAAARALRWSGDKSPVDELIRALDDPAPEVTIAAARALGNSKEPRAVIPLIRKLTMEVATGRLAVAEALGELKDRRALEGLASLLESRSQKIRETAIASLNRIDPEWAASEPGQVIFARLVVQLDHDDPHLRRDASMTLGGMGEAAAVPNLLGALGDSEQMVRLAVGDALMHLGVSETFDPLAISLLDEIKSPQRKSGSSVQDPKLNSGHPPLDRKGSIE